MEQFWFDFISKQLPVIVVLGFFCYAMYKYFIAVVEDKDEKIESKDKKIEELNSKLLELTVKCIEAINRNTEAFNNYKRNL